MLGKTLIDRERILGSVSANSAATSNSLADALRADGHDPQDDADRVVSSPS
ncbi:MAG: hypothetical protein R3B46_00195 [Phycisphaerales bacterium]